MGKVQLKPLKLIYFVFFLPIIILSFLAIYEANDNAIAGSSCSTTDIENKSKILSKIDKSRYTHSQNVDSPLNNFYKMFISPLKKHSDTNDDITNESILQYSNNHKFNESQLKFILHRPKLDLLFDGTFPNAQMFVSYLFMALKEKFIIIYDGDKSIAVAEAETMMKLLLDFGIHHDFDHDLSEIILVNLGVKNINNVDEEILKNGQTEVFRNIEKYLYVPWSNVILAFKFLPQTSNSSHLKNLLHEIESKNPKISKYFDKFINDEEQKEKTFFSLNGISVTSPFKFYEAFYIGLDAKNFFYKFLQENSREEKVVMFIDSNKNDHRKFYNIFQEIAPNNKIEIIDQKDETFYRNMYTKYISQQQKENRFWIEIFMTCQSNKLPIVFIDGKHCIDGETLEDILEIALEDEEKQMNNYKAKLNMFPKKEFGNLNENVNMLKSKLNEMKKEMKKNMMSNPKRSNREAFKKDIKGKIKYVKAELKKYDKVLNEGCYKNLSKRKINIYGYGVLSFGNKYVKEDFLNYSVFMKFKIMAQDMAKKRGTIFVL